MTKITNFMRVCDTAIRWINDAKECIKTPGLGVPDASDSIMMAENCLDEARNMLKNINKK